MLETIIIIPFAVFVLSGYMYNYQIHTHRRHRYNKHMYFKRQRINDKKLREYELKLEEYILYKIECQGTHNHQQQSSTTK